MDLYKDDLPLPQLFFAEFERWKMKVQARIITADLCAASLKACDPDDFPNLYILLKIAATLPVTSCECECMGLFCGQNFEREHINVLLNSLLLCVIIQIGK